MLAFIVLFVSLLIFRAIGALGIALFFSWIACTRYAVALMFLFTGSAHFTRMRYDFARMMPKIFPNPMAVVSQSAVRSAGRSMRAGDVEECTR